MFGEAGVQDSALEKLSAVSLIVWFKFALGPYDRLVEGLLDVFNYIFRDEKSGN